MNPDHVLILLIGAVFIINILLPLLMFHCLCNRLIEIEIRIENLRIKQEEKSHEKQTTHE